MSFANRYVKERAKRDPEFKKVWEENALEREIAAQLIGIRLDLGMTQQ